MSRVTVLGTGAWGTTMAQVLCDAGQDVLMWGRNSDVVSEINSHHTNTKFLGDQSLPSQLRATQDIAQALSFGEAIILAVPAQSLRENLTAWKSIFPIQVPVISTLKGIEATTDLRMSDVLVEVLDLDPARIGLITGPNLADELIARQPAGAVRRAADS